MEIREDIIWLAKNTDKPFFIIGFMEPIYDPDQKHVSFVNVRPYAWRCSTKKICQHVNLIRKDVEECVDVNLDNFGHEFMICVKPYIYHDEETGVERGGLNVDTSIIKDAVFKICLKKFYLSPIPQELYLDFRKVRNGKYILTEYEEEDKRPAPHRYKTRYDYSHLYYNKDGTKKKKFNITTIQQKRAQKLNSDKLSKKRLKELRNAQKWKTMAEADEEKNAT